MNTKTCINNRVCAFLWRGLILLLCVAGLAVTLGINPNGEKYFFYTTQISLAIAVAYIIITIKTAYETNRYGVKGEPHSLPTVIQLGLVMMSLLSLFVYSTLVRDQAFVFTGSTFRQLQQTANLFLHFFVPLTVFLDWLLFTPKGKAKYYYIAIWTAFPLLYYAGTIIRANLFHPSPMPGGRYPYPFLNVDVIGIPKVAVIVFTFVIAIAFISYLLIIIDRNCGKFLLLCKKKPKRRKA